MRLELGLIMCAVNSAGVFSSFECDKTNNQPKFSDALALNMSRIAEASMLGFQFVVESFLLTASTSERQSPNVKAERVATGQGNVEIMCLNVEKIH